MKSSVICGLLPTLLFLLLYSCKPKEEMYEPMRPEVIQIFHTTNRVLNSGSINEYVDLLDSLYAGIEEPNTLEIWSKYQHKALFFLRYQVELDKAMAYKDSMGLVLEGKETVYKVEYARNFYMEGDILSKQKRYADAFRSYFAGREYARLNLPPCSAAHLTYQLALFKYSQRQFDETITYVKQAYEEVIQCGDNESFELKVKDPQMYLNTIALSYEKLGQLDSAIAYYTKALEFIMDRYDDYSGSTETFEYHFLEVAEGVIRGNLGGALRLKGDYENAESQLIASIHINDRPGYDNPDARTAKVKLAYLYLDQGADEKAGVIVRDLESTIDLITPSNPAYYETRARFHKLRWTYYDQIGDVQKAYDNLNTYMTLYEQVERQADQSRFLDMEEAFRVTDQQYELALVSRKNEIKNIYLFGVVLFLVVAVGFLVNVIYHLRRFRKINKQISEQNIEMQDALGALEQSQAENSRMMHIVAHDLRSPISSMTMIADILLESGNWSEEDRTLIEHIKISGNNSLNLVSELLQVNRASEGIKKEEVDLARMINYCVDLMQYKAQEKGQRIVVETEPISALISREKMWRVISNLIGNAIKFSEKGKTIYVSLEKKADSALITVEDQGIGIPDKIKEAVFELYTNSKRAGTAGETPHGMGLAIAKQIVKAHGGKIWFESKEGRGTTFFVELPLEQ